MGMKHLKAPTGLAQLPTISCKNKSLRINDFMSVYNYNIPPSQWIRDKRLSKDKYGYPPSERKQNVNLD